MMLERVKGIEPPFHFHFRNSPVKTHFLEYEKGASPAKRKRIA